MSLSPVSGISDAVQEFIRACGLDPTNTGDFTVEVSRSGVVAATFNVFLTEEQFKKLRAVVEADPAALRKASQFNVTVMGLR